MSAEYKYCPKCHIINSPSAKKCECGHSFADAPALTEAELAELVKGKKRRSAMRTAVACVLIVIFTLLAIKFGIVVLLIAIASVAVLLLGFSLLYRLKSSYDRKRLGD